MSFAVGQRVRRVSNGKLATVLEVNMRVPVMASHGEHRDDGVAINVDDGADYIIVEPHFIEELDASQG